MRRSDNPARLAVAQVAGFAVGGVSIAVLVVRVLGV